MAKSPSSISRVSPAQCFPADETAILVPYRVSPHDCAQGNSDKNTMCGFYKKIGEGVICAVTADYPADMGFYRRLWELMEIKASLYAPYSRRGIYLARTASADGQRLIYAVNLDVMDKTVDLYLDGELLFHDFLLAEKASLILPVYVIAGNALIIKSTAEIAEIEKKGIRFFLTQKGSDTIVLKGKVLKSDEYVMEQSGTCCTLFSPVVFLFLAKSWIFLFQFPYSIDLQIQFGLFLLPLGLPMVRIITPLYLILLRTKYSMPHLLLLCNKKCPTVRLGFSAKRWLTFS